MEAAVVPDEVDGFIEDLFEKPPVVCDRCNPDDRCRFTIVMVNFSNRDIEAVFEPLDDAFYDMAFILEAVYAEQMHLNC